jgi:hypothetical protein
VSRQPKAPTPSPLRVGPPAHGGGSALLLIVAGVLAAALLLGARHAWEVRRRRRVWRAYERS